MFIHFPIMLFNKSQPILLPMYDSPKKIKIKEKRKAYAKKNKTLMVEISKSCYTSKQIIQTMVAVFMPYV